MMSAIKQKPIWQHLRQSDGGEAFITPKEGEPFGLPIDEAVEACKSWEKVGQFSRQVNDLLECFTRWLADRQTEIDRAFFALEPDGVVFAVVRKDRAFDPDFEDALSQLDLDVAQDDAYSLIKLRVIASSRSRPTIPYHRFSISGGLGVTCLKKRKNSAEPIHVLGS